MLMSFFFFFQAEDGIRDIGVTGVQTCALPISLELNACILTKLDGDARGGAALSIKGVTGVPIKFVGVGEKVDKLEDFVPERMAGRILGQGDLMGVVEKIASIQKEISEEDLKKQQEALAKGNFTLDMFRDQFQM